MLYNETCILSDNIQDVREYDQEMPQPHTSDHLMVPRRRVTEHKQPHDTMKGITIEQPTLSSPTSYISFLHTG